MALRLLWAVRFFPCTEAELEASRAVVINISAANLHSLPSALWIPRFPAAPSLFRTAEASSLSPIPSASPAITPTPPMPWDLPLFPRTVSIAFVISYCLLSP